MRQLPVVQNGKSFTQHTERISSEYEFPGIGKNTCDEVGYLILTYTLINTKNSKPELLISFKQNIKPQLKFMIISHQSMIKPYKHIWISNFLILFWNLSSVTTLFLKYPKPWNVKKVFL